MIINKSEIQKKKEKLYVKNIFLNILVNTHFLLRGTRVQQKKKFKYFLIGWVDQKNQKVTNTAEYNFEGKVKKQSSYNCE